MKIQIFDGGKVSRPRPQYLELNQAVKYNNIDNSLRSLAPVKTKLATAIAASKFNYYFDVTQEWFGSDIRRDYVSYQGELYWTDGVAPKVYKGGVTNKLGIDAPTTAPTVVVSEPLAEITSVRYEVALTGDLPLVLTHYKLVNFDGTYYSTPKNIDINLSNSKVLVRPDDRYIDIYESIGPVAPTTGSLEIFPPEGLDYASGGVQVYRQYKEKWYLVGTMTDPGVGPIVSIEDNVHDISANTELDETKIAEVDGDVQYVYTFYNSTDGIESAPSPITDVETVKGVVNLSNIQVSTDPQVDTKRLYRVGGFATTFTLVTELPNATTVYEDRTKDTELVGDLLDSSLNTPAPLTLKYLTEANAMLFGAEGSKLRFTPIGKPAYWPEIYFLEFYSEITGIGSTGSGLLVFTRYKTYIVYGTGPTLLSQQLLDGEQGCVSHASIQPVGSAIMWLSTDGLCMSNGAPATVVSQNALGKLSFDIVDSVVHDQVYYMVDSTGEVLAYDFRFGGIFKTFSLDILSFAKGTDKLYGVANSVLNELFTGVSTEEFTYLSPRFIEGRVSEYKTYKKVYVYAKGDIIINIFINDILVLTKSLSGEDAHEMQVPQNMQRGNYIQLEIKGTGEVYEYEYVVGRGHGHG